MSSKQEIKDLFVAELLNTPEYQIILNIKQLILNEIATPNIQENVIYTFENLLTKDQQNILSLCSIVEFGFKIDNMNEFCAVIDMKKFLD
jgi:hypothetical protein